MIMILTLLSMSTTLIKESEGQFHQHFMSRTAFKRADPKSVKN